MAKYECPFCGGSKTTPYTSHSKNQNCVECDKGGEISEAKIRRYGLEGFVRGYERPKKSEYGLGYMQGRGAA